MQDSNPYKTIDELNAQSWELRYSDAEKASQFAETALRLSDKENYEKGKAYAYLNKGVCSFLLSKGDDTLLPTLNTAFHYFEQVNDFTGLAKALNYISNVYDSYGEYDKGLEYCLKGLKIAETINYKEGLGDLYSTIGNIYFRLSDYSHALESYHKSLLIREEMNELKAAASSMNLIARVYTTMDDFENGLIYYNKSLVLRKEMNDPSISWTYLGLAALYDRKKEDTKALEYYDKCMQLNSGKDKRLELHGLMGMGRYYIKVSNADKSIEIMQQAMKLAHELNAKPLEYEIHKLLAEIYEKRLDTKKALEHFKFFQQIKESVLNIESANRLKNQQISYAIERSEKEAEIQRIRNVELKGAYDKIEEKNKDITASINYALRIQNAMLPEVTEMYKALPESFILFIPKDIVSGDFFFFKYFPLGGKGIIYIAAADCTGHGVPGALMSMLGIEKLNNAIQQNGDVSEILNQVNREVRKALRQSKGDTKDGMDIALCSIKAMGNEEINLINYAAANRPLWIVKKDIEQIEEIKATKVAIGGYTDDEQVFEKHETELHKGDSLYIFSDGFADQFGGELGKKFTTKRFKDLLLTIRDSPMQKQKEIIEKVFSDWKGKTEQTDDVLIIGVRI